MYYKCHKVYFRRGSSYIDSPDWIKKEKAKNPKNAVDKCFQYTATFALNYKKLSGTQKEFRVLNHL